MPVNEFCEKHGLDLKLVMKRMNTCYWEDFDSIVVPQEVGTLSADKVRRTLELIDLGWEKKAIQTRMKIKSELLENIENLDEYYKSMFRNMDNYFYLNPKKVDVEKVISLMEASKSKREEEKKFKGKEGA